MDSELDPTSAKSMVQHGAINRFELIGWGILYVLVLGPLAALALAFVWTGS